MGLSGETAASMVGGTLFTYPDNFRAQKAEIAAKYSGDQEVDHPVLEVGGRRFGGSQVQPGKDSEVIRLHRWSSRSMSPTLLRSGAFGHELRIVSSFELPCSFPVFAPFQMT